MIKLYAKDWLSLHFQKTFNARNQTIRVVDTSKLKMAKTSKLTD